MVILYFFVGSNKGDLTMFNEFKLSKNATVKAEKKGKGAGATYKVIDFFGRESEVLAVDFEKNFEAIKDNPLFECRVCHYSITKLSPEYRKIKNNKFKCPDCVNGVMEEV